MTRIPVAICRLSDNKFKRIYLKKEKLFLYFLLNFWNVHEISKILKKKNSVLDELLPKLLHPKEMFT